MQSAGPVRGISYNSNCVTFAGNALVNGQSGYTFTFSAWDRSTLVNGIGTFSVNLTGPGGYVYTKSAAMTSGYVYIHPH